MAMSQSKKYHCRECELFYDEAKGDPGAVMPAVPVGKKYRRIGVAHYTAHRKAFSSCWLANSRAGRAIVSTCHYPAKHQQLHRCRPPTGRHYRIGNPSHYPPCRLTSLAANVGRSCNSAVVAAARSKPGPVHIQPPVVVAPVGSKSLPPDTLADSGRDDGDDDRGNHPSGRPAPLTKPISQSLPKLCVSTSQNSFYFIVCLSSSLQMVA